MNPNSRPRLTIALGAVALGLMLVFLSGCNALPSLTDRTSSTTDPNTGGTRLALAHAAGIMAHPGKSGVYALSDGRDAFAARALLAQAAERTLDVQYYIWHDDMTGTLLFAALRRAADRGVRVRLLLDDNNTTGLDALLAALDAHALIEVRLFNPFANRGTRALGYLTDFHRANRRMHNKSFTADNQATIVGGRNVGDAYFGAADDVLFADLDVMAIGPVVTEVSKDFDRYWNSDSSYPAAGLLPTVGEKALEELETIALSIEQSARAEAYVRALRNATFAKNFAAGSLSFDWAVTRMISDDPAKGLGLAEPRTLVVNKLKKRMGEPVKELNLVSPYFVPTDVGTDALVELAQGGVKVRVLTNSLEATDVAAVHAGYARHRKELLEAGVSLFELRRLSQNSAKKRMRGLGGSSDSSLHSKTFTVDRARVFIGSFNFDPRSSRLNTEMGFVIDSPALADRILDAFDRRMPTEAYEVRLAPDGALYWLERQGKTVVRHDVEPGTSLGERAGVFFMSMLPIESLL
ncbi:phospholipase D family protein [Pseudoduganella plicata]|uniref:Phospholipase D family protein n=1 Tax=Pseudoduganella plicata TaxID=321984 RepID=A0A4P7BHA0_9BURK|nr:phospholipase D family protein [Pseudoduganella plicata]QBQ38181.1 phospholipase D family protein [Pseudoduganella plicata]GGZ11462.1 phospholipase D family protein [Pseudoduganella plicata]